MKAKSKVFAGEKVKEHISRTTLRKQRGWTDLMIDYYFEKPHKIVDNPHYKSAAPMQLYKITEIEKAEASDDFKLIKERAEIRKLKASKAVTTKREKILNYVKSFRIEVPEITEEKLIESACDSYNSHKAQLEYERGYEYTPATKDSDSDFLNRICTNYLRHRLTSYEIELQRIFGRVASQEAHDILKERINEAIFNKYPFLIEL